MPSVIYELRVTYTPTCTYDDVKKFCMKRSPKKYALCTEVGKNKTNPHAHAVLHVDTVGEKALRADLVQLVSPLKRGYRLHPVDNYEEINPDYPKYAVARKYTIHAYLFKERLKTEFCGYDDKFIKDCDELCSNIRKDWEETNKAVKKEKKSAWDRIIRWFKEELELKDDYWVFKADASQPGSVPDVKWVVKHLQEYIRLQIITENKQYAESSAVRYAQSLCYMFVPGYTREIELLDKVQPKIRRDELMRGNADDLLNMIREICNK